MVQEGLYTNTAEAQDVTRLAAERVRFMYRMSGFGTVAATLVALITGAYFWTVHESQIAVGLMFYFALIALIRSVVFIQYRRADDLENNPEPWIVAATITMLFSGIGWGTMSWFLFDAAGANSALIISVVVTSMLVSGILLLAPFSRLILVFAIPTAVPLIIKLATSSEMAYLVTAMVFSLVLVTIYMTALRIQAGLNQSLKLALQNRQLAKVMAQSKSELETLNDELSSHIENRARVEEELRQAKRAAEAAVMSKDEFLATMSHEIRTPLNGILPILDILRSTELDDTQKDYLNTAFQSSKHLLSIIDDILDYSKIEAGKLELETVGLNLRELLDSVVRLMSSSASKKNLDLWVKFDPGVRIALRGDPVRLRQILTNLVSNAIKFTEKGHVEVTVSTRSETRDQTELLFAVKDTGIGMDRATADRLFRPFSQADASTTRTYGGSGLGLAICKRLVELMGGKIGVKSDPGRGSVFWFSIHLRKSLGDIQADRKKLEDSRILMGCADDALRQRLGVFMQSWGSNITEVSNLRELAAKIRDSLTMGSSWAFDILVLDTPSMGPQCAELIRRVRKDLRFNTMGILVLNRDGILPEPLAEFDQVIAADRSLSQGALHEATERLLLGEEEPILAPRLPSSDEAYADEDSLDAAQEPEEASAGITRGSKILLVEDNPVNLHVAQKLLSLVGAEHDIAKNGKEAVKLLTDGAYQAVLMDCMMPVMDGYSATREWRKYEQQHGRERTPIIAMTANAMAGDRQKCIDSGMDDYMAKPLNKQLLDQMLRRWLTEAKPQPPAAAASRPASANAARESAGSSATAASDEGAEILRPAASDGPSVLDRQVLDDLIDIMGDEYVDLISVYLEDTPNCLSALDDAVAADDIDAMVAPAHSLKSTSANLGAMGLSEMAKEIELGARQGEVDGGKEKVAAMHTEFKQVRQELERIRGG